MKYYKCIFLIVFLSSMSIFSQEKYKQHTVSKGETISEIAQQYNISPKAILELNPKAKKGIKYHTVLLIPTKTKKHTTVSTPDIAIPYPEKTHEVLPKETLYGIAKQHHITIEDLYKSNADLEKEGLKMGQIIKLPQTATEDLAVAKETERAIEVKKPNVSQKNIPKEEVVVAAIVEEKMEIPTEGMEYQVLPKESLYSIAKQHGITLSELKKANSQLRNKPLKVGQTITIPVKANANSSLIAEKITEKKEVKTEKELAIAPQVNNEVKNPETEITHEVLAKETKFGIAKQYGLTIAELERQNPNISKTLLVGSVLKISGSKLIEKKIAIENGIALDAAFVKDKFENKDLNTVRDAGFVDQLISKASENIGTPYRSGGTSTAGFDCSGLMCYTFSSYDIKLPRSSIEMSSYGSKIDAQSAQKGDLIFFKTNGRRQINHVGMVIEVSDGEIKFIHSSNHGGVMISSTKESYYEKNFAQVNRVLQTQL
ncbi:MAG: LysM peptidoglycan-binding domain-containing protein [Flavobacterium sp.]|nr:LysM peptidoglycan-binding domain-containing protein [Flavobacterium sp.]